jgi:hypothetical protein
MSWTQNSSFSTTIPKFQLAWDSTSLGSFKTCPRKYYYEIIEGWTPRAANIHLAFGLLYHSSLELYDHKRAQGLDHDEATLHAVRHLMIETWDEVLGRPKPVFCEDKNKNRFTLVRTVVWYLEQFRDDPLRTIILANGKPAVELSFRFETDHRASDGTPILYCGHMDRAATLDEVPFVVDRKTSKHTISDEYFAQFTPNNQFTGYIMGGRIILPNAPKKLIVDAAQIAVTFSRFERGIVERSDFQIDEWYTGLGYYFKLAEGYARANFWPLNEASCGNYGGCPFRTVCSKKSPLAREEWLAAGFVKRIWDPLQTRGDI